MVCSQINIRKKIKTITDSNLLKAAPTVRTEFPETWLFDLVPVNQLKRLVV